jgi:DNA-binding NarL/FixJ family response regulator
LKTIKLGIADDHAILREGLKILISTNNDIEVVAEAGTAKLAVKMVTDNEIDLLILDINMPDQSGVDIIQKIRKINKDIPILVFTMHDENQYALRCLKMGAQCFLNKQVDSKELIKAIRTLAQGKKYISPYVAELLANNISGNIQLSPHESLSAREFQVFSMIAKGLAVSEIATQVSLSVKTISMYRSRSLVKLNLRNNSEIMRYALQNKVVE